MPVRILSEDIENPEAIVTPHNVAADSHADIRTSVSAMESRTTSLEGDVATAQSDISTLQTDVSAAEGNISALQGNVATLAQGIADAVSTHNTAPDAHADIRTLVAGKQDSLTISPVGTALLNLSTPAAAQIPRINADASVTLIDAPSNVEEVDANFVSITYNPGGGGTNPDTPHRLSFANSGWLTWESSSGFWSGGGAAFTIVAEVLAVASPNSNWPTIARIGGLDGSGNAMLLRIRRDYSPHRLEFYIAVGGTLYLFQSSASITFFDASWHKVVATSDGTPTGIKVYFDGTELSGSVSNDGATTPGAPKLYVGGDSSGNAGWLGHIRQLCFSVGTAWSSADVIAWQGGSELPVAPTWVLDLTGGWPVDAVSGAAGAQTNFCSDFQVH